MDKTPQVDVKTAELFVTFQGEVAVNGEWKSNNLSNEHNEFIRKINFLNKSIKNKSRFRVYGEIRDSIHKIFVVTEFCELSKDNYFWEKITQRAKELNAHMWHMTTYETGLNERKQIELSWRIEHLSIVQFKELLNNIRRKTQRLWQKAGVSVW